MKYRPQLDYLRAYSVTMLLVNHLWLTKTEVADLGVLSFFVLSGFLITRTLLENPSIGEFYWRRGIRLFPAYYACLAADLLFNLEGMRATWGWHAFELTDVFVYQRQSWEAAWPSDHLWSLDVEWQFYLAWPLILRFTPRKHLRWAAVALIVLSLVYKDLDQADQVGTLPFGWLDALGVGILLALYEGRPKVLYVLGLLAAPFAVMHVAHPTEITGAASLAVLSALVLGAWRNALPIPVVKPVQALGRISYGVYIYHLLVEGLLGPLNLPEGFLNFAVVSVLTVALAWVSFHYFEEPIRKRGRNLVSDWKARRASGAALPEIAGLGVQPATVEAVAAVPLAQADTAPSG